MSLHSLRLWAAEMAYRSEVPRDLRKCISHWSQETTADTYTLDHASIVTKTWNNIFDNYERANDLADTAGGDPSPSDPYYLGQESCPITKIRVELNPESSAHKDNIAGVPSGSSSSSNDSETETTAEENQIRLRT